MVVSLRPYQQQACEAVESEWASGNLHTLLSMATGCHDPKQGILMSDGSVKAAEDVAIGDALMGPDGKPRRVLALHGGEDEMYEICPVKGSAFKVNAHHILSLVSTNRGGSRNTDGAIDNISVLEWLDTSKTYKHMHKLYRAGAIERFDGNDGSMVTLNPYFLGVLLGDGGLSGGSISVTTPDKEIIEEIESQCSRYGMTYRTSPAGKADTFFFRSGQHGKNGGWLRSDLKSLGLLGSTSGEKHVPHYYKTLPIDKRLELLAGLMDTDGSHTNGGFDYISKSRQLSDDVAFIARSCGLAAYVKSCTKGIRSSGFSGTYWRVSISGDCSIIPTRVAHKKAPARRQKKNVLRTGFSVEYVGRGEYRGFTVDGDNLYLLDDFTVTHNCGKTTVFGEIARRKLDTGVLVLAHRDELIRQAAARLSDMCGVTAEVEKADEHYRGVSPLCIGSVQTLCNESRLSAFPAHTFGTVIVDEAHHSVSDSYKRVLAAFPYARVLGVTATPDRSDKRGLAEVYDSIAYEYGIERAVHEGYLSPIKAKLVPLSMDISSVKVSHGDYQVGELGDALEPYLASVAKVMAEECATRKTVVFLPLVSTAEKMADALNAAGMRAVTASGYDDAQTRKDKLAAFERGEYDVICNSMLLTEGWDCPEVDCVVMLRPTKSRSLYAQCIGRGTRITEGKQDLLLLDFLWQTEKHDLCRPATLLGAEPAIVAKMCEGIERRGYAGEEVDLLEAEDEAKAEVQAEREASLAKKLEEQRHRKKKLVDPLQYAVSIMNLDLTDYQPIFAWQKAEPTPKQKETLEKFQIDPTEIETKGQASALLDALMTRIDAGLSTPKQIRFLEGRGYRHVGTWTKEQASYAIGRISSNGWKVPWDIRPGVLEETDAFKRRKVA